jgi:hypothetical protein
MLVKYKHTNLLHNFVNYGGKKLYNIGPRSWLTDSSAKVMMSLLDEEPLHPSMMAPVGTLT